MGTVVTVPRYDSQRDGSLAKIGRHPSPFNKGRWIVCIPHVTPECLSDHVAAEITEWTVRDGQPAGKDSDDVTSTF